MTEMNLKGLRERSLEVKESCEHMFLSERVLSSYKKLFPLTFQIGDSRCNCCEVQVSVNQVTMITNLNPPTSKSLIRSKSGFYCLEETGTHLLVRSNARVNFSIVIDQINERNTAEMDKQFGVLGFQFNELNELLIRLLHLPSDTLVFKEGIDLIALKIVSSDSRYLSFLGYLLNGVCIISHYHISGVTTIEQILFVD